MAKTIEEIIEVHSNFEKIENLEVIEIFCGFNDAKEKTVFSGAVENLPDFLKNLKFSESTCGGGKMTVKYIDQKSFEEKKLHQLLQI